MNVIYHKLSNKTNSSAPGQQAVPTKTYAQWDWTKARPRAPLEPRLIQLAGPGPDQPVHIGIDGLRPGRRIAGGIGVRRRRARLERLLDCALGTRARPYSRFRADPDQLDSRRRPEWNVGFAGERHFHEVAEIGAV